MPAMLIFLSISLLCFTVAAVPYGSPIIVAPK